MASRLGSLFACRVVPAYTSSLKQLIPKTSFVAKAAFVQTRQVHVERRMKELGFEIPHKTVEPKGNYIICVRTGNLIFVAGHIPQKPDGELITGKIGVDMTTEEGYDAAQLCALNIIATLKAELGDLDKVKKVVKVLGFVSCHDDFTEQVNVVNGASDMFGTCFGEKGIHSRAAVGTNSLPLRIPVEIEAIVEVEEGV